LHGLDKPGEYTTLCVTANQPHRLFIIAHRGPFIHTASQPKEAAKPAGIEAVPLPVGEGRDEFEALVGNASETVVILWRRG